MVMGWIFVAFLAVSTIFCIFSGNSPASAILSGAQAGITLAISLGGSLCLWSGVGKLMEKVGLTDRLAKWMRPVLTRLFPSSASDPQLQGYLSANVCANLLGLGNAATPMGILAAKGLASSRRASAASPEMCRLIVLNTASIQLIPTNVAAIRSALGCVTPFDILPAVWITSFLSAGIGVASTFLLERMWRDA